jgi:hypothetical protein
VKYSSGAPLAVSACKQTNETAETYVFVVQILSSGETHQTSLTPLAAQKERTHEIRERLNAAFPPQADNQENGKKIKWQKNSRLK